MNLYPIKNYITTFIICLLGWNSIAQKIIHEHYTTENGLPDDATYQIIQGKDGYIWICTDDGLSKFDGSKFIQYSEKGLTSNYVIDIVEHKTPSNLLIATWGGGIHLLKNDNITKPDIRKDRFTKVNKLYPINDSIIIGASNTNQFIYNLKKKEVKTFNFYHRDSLNTIQFKEYNINDSSNIIRDVNISQSDSTLYIFKSEINFSNPYDLLGVHSLKDLNLKKLNIKELNNIPIHYFNKKDNHIIAASFNDLYIYNKGKLILKENLNLANGKIIQMSKLNNKLYFVYNYKENGIRSLFSFNLNNKELINISKVLKIQSPISDIMFDRDNNLWATTYGQGVYQIKNLNNIFLDKSYFSNPDLKDVTFLDHNIFAVAPNIIYNIDLKETVTSKRVPFFTETLQVDSNNNLNVIMPGEQNESYNTNLNSIKIKNKNCRNFTFKYKDQEFYIEGIHYTFTNKNKLTYSGSFDKNLATNAKDAVLYKNKLYVSFKSYGIYEMNLDSRKITKWNKTKNFDAKNYTSLIVQKDTIWLGTNTGIYKITPQSTSHFTQKNGLSSNHINHLFTDKHNTLWAATQKGVSILYKNNFYSIDKNTGQKSISTKKIIEVNNFIYVAGNKGLFKYDNTLKFTPKSNTTFIIKQNNNIFDFKTINFVNPKSVRVAYKLNNNPWKFTTNNKLDFNNIKQGSYNLNFKFKDNLSEWKYSKNYTFKIRYPWHQQTWFYVTLTSIILGLLIILLMKGLKKSMQSNKKLEKNIIEKEKLELALKEVRKNVARDFHDELGNKLASISISSGMLLDNNYEINGEKREKRIKQIKTDADYLYHGMKDFIWSLDHKNDDLQQLQVYLNDFGEHLFENTDISFYSSHNLTESQITLPYYWSKQLVLIFKEAMTNTLKHSKASKVELNFTLKKDNIFISLKDNGVGFSKKKITRINGMNNMKERAKSIQQELLIKSRPGVNIIFTGKLKKQ